VGEGHVIRWLFGHKAEATDQPAWVEIFCRGELVGAMSIGPGWFRCSGCGKALQLSW
jgi:hypothetical protein